MSPIKVYDRPPVSPPHPTLLSTPDPPWRGSPEAHFHTTLVKSRPGNGTAHRKPEDLYIILVPLTTKTFLPNGFFLFQRGNRAGVRKHKWDKVARLRLPPTT